MKKTKKQLLALAICICMIVVNGYTDTLFALASEKATTITRETENPTTTDEAENIEAAQSLETVTETVTSEDAADAVSEESEKETEGDTEENIASILEEEQALKEEEPEETSIDAEYLAKLLDGDIVENAPFSLKSFSLMSAAINDTSEPASSITSTAKWIDIENGIAEVTLTESDASRYDNKPVDYILILDRSGSMAMNAYYQDGHVGESTAVDEGNCPCLNPNHYYYYNDRFIRMIDWYTGYDLVTGEIIPNLIYDELYKKDCHYEFSTYGKISQSYSSGCYDRYIISKNIMSDMVDTIADTTASLDVKNRVSYFTFSDQVYNFIDFTTDYGSVKQQIQNTYHNAGTEFAPALQKAIDTINGRNGTGRETMPVKIIFVSDGVPTDDHTYINQLVTQLKDNPYVTIYTVGLGMTSNNIGYQMIKNMATDPNTGFSSALLNISEEFQNAAIKYTDATVEVKAINKVVTDHIDTRYFDFVSFTNVSGGTATIQNNDQITWSLPDTQGTRTCTFRVKLKDEYRYLANSDTFYPANNDSSSDGVRFTYAISGGQSHGQTRSLSTATNTLKYGTYTVTGTKDWTITGSEPGSLLITVERSLNGGSYEEVNRSALTAPWSYSFTTRSNGDPLVAYDNNGLSYAYRTDEVLPAHYNFFEQVPVNDDHIITSNLKNEPDGAYLTIKKTDSETDAPLTGATFTVYQWSEASQTYIPYMGNESTMHGDTVMIMDDLGDGSYKTPYRVYYRPDNGGKFRVIETLAPSGYVGDFPDHDPANEKNVYDLVVTPDKNETTIDLGEVEELRVKGQITFSKYDYDTKEDIAPGYAGLEDAEYGLYAREDIIYQDKVTTSSTYADSGVPGLLYKADDLVATGTTDSNGQIVFDGLELGRYYLKELSASEGYLIDPDELDVDVLYVDERTPVVVVDPIGYEHVKKASLSFFKVEDTDKSTELNWLSGAGFTVYDLTTFNGGAYNDMDSMEIIQAIVDDYRNTSTLLYEMGREAPASLYADADSSEVTDSLLVKDYSYESGEAYSHTSTDRQYYINELISEDGRVVTPRLPYGRYVVVETTVPTDLVPIRPFVISITEDDIDGTIYGDDEGTPLANRIFEDNDMKAFIKIEKTDATTGQIVMKSGVSYVIHDIDGAWHDYYLADAATEEKKDYEDRFGDLVAQYGTTAGQHYGTYENPFTTKTYNEGQMRKVYIS